MFGDARQAVCALTNALGSHSHRLAAQHGVVWAEAVTAKESVLNLANLATLALAGVMLAACGETARLTAAEGTGPQPRWVPPNPTLIPTVYIAPSRGWSVGATPQAARFANGIFIGRHGSWNRRPHSGYQVIFVPFDGARPSGAPPLEVLTGFLDREGHAYGRPVGVVVDRQGGLLVADDVGNVVWRVTSAP